MRQVAKDKFTELDQLGKNLLNGLAATKVEVVD